MIPLWAALAAGGAGLGVLKSEFVDAPRENKQRQIQATTTRYSPWTGLKGEEPQAADPFASAITGGATGAALGQNATKLEGDLAFQKSQTDLNNRTPSLPIKTPAEQGPNTTVSQADGGGDLEAIIAQLIQSRDLRQKYNGRVA